MKSSGTFFLVLFKLLVNFDGSGVELYNIEQEETETTNVAIQYPEITEELTKKVIEWYTKTVQFID